MIFFYYLHAYYIPIYYIIDFLPMGKPCLIAVIFFTVG